MFAVTPAMAILARTYFSPMSFLPRGNICCCGGPSVLTVVIVAIVIVLIVQSQNKNKS